MTNLETYLKTGIPVNFEHARTLWSQFLLDSESYICYADQKAPSKSRQVREEVRQRRERQKRDWAIA